MHKITLVIGFVGILFLGGCVNPSFNPVNKHIVFVDGKPFRVPNGSSATPHRYSRSAIDQERIKIYNQYGMNCNIGDILWMENHTALKAKKEYQTKGKIAGYNYVGIAFRQGKSGCVKPLTPQEFQYYRQKEQEATALAIAQSNIVAATAPKTVDVNVNHSGYINQSINANVHHYYGY